MGTNYYTMKKEPCQTCPHGGEDYHIGKSFWGWRFLFASYPNENLTSKKAWEEFLKGRLIKNEYGEQITYEEFWRIVAMMQNNSISSDLSRYETLDDEGYRISKSYDFS